jgi:GT2 family glycosyltransferase
MKPLVSIVIVSYNTRQLVKDCIESIYNQVRGIPYEIVVVDNASSDGSQEMIRQEYPDVILIANDRNVGFGVASNTGVSKCTGSYLMFLNSDTVLLEDTVSVLLAFLKGKPNAGIVGPVVLLSDGIPQPKSCGNFPCLRVVCNDAFFLSKLFGGNKLFSGMHFPSDEINGEETEVDWISGVCMLMQKSLFLEVGGFDPSFFMYSEDIDLCWKVKKRGLTVFRLNTTRIIHQCGASSRTESQKVKNSILQQRNLLALLHRNYGSRELFLIRSFMVAGLVIRAIAAFPGFIIGNSEIGLKWNCSVARLKDLVRDDRSSMSGI